MKHEITERRSRINFGLIVVFAISTLFGAMGLRAQTPTVFTTGLNSPSKLILAGQNSMLVSEPGMVTPNSGRLSVVNRQNGNRTTLIDGLPSAINLSGGAPEASGPSGLKLVGQTLFLTIGAGNTSTPVTGGSILNPAPSSPLFDSVLELTLPPSWETLGSGFTLTEAGQITLAGNTPIVLVNNEGQQLTVRLVINLPDFVANPLPAVPANVRESNLYGVELFGSSLYVIDASFNLLYRVSLATGTAETFATFASRPNPTQIGPPFVEPVPDSIKLVGDSFVISFLTGFPFAANFSEVRTVNANTGAQAVLISGLTTALDVFPFDPAAVNGPYLVLEYSTNFLAQAPGRLSFFTSPTAQPFVMTTTLTTPTSVVREPLFGIVYVTEKSTGRIMRIQTTTAAGVEISGRVTTPDGRGLRGAEVSMVLPNGETRTAITSAFGFYQFTDVPAGETCVMSVASKRYRFSSRSVQISDSLTDIDFVGEQ